MMKSVFTVSVLLLATPFVEAYQSFYVGEDIPNVVIPQEKQTRGPASAEENVVRQISSYQTAVDPGNTSINTVQPELFQNTNPSRINDILPPETAVESNSSNSSQ